MCLATVYNTRKPDSILFELVSRMDVEGTTITLTDVMGERKTVEGTIEMVDLAGGKVKINCPD